MGIEMKSLGKELIVDESSVHLALKGLVRKNKTIPFSNILSVEVKKPGLFAGYIYFATAAEPMRKSVTVDDVGRSDNGFIFNGKEKYQTALEIKSKIETWQTNRTPGADSVSSADELVKWKQLLDTGVITEKEFEAKKKQLLGL